MENGIGVMSSQNRRASLVEALVNTAIGFCVSLVATLTILPAVGVEDLFKHGWNFTNEPAPIDQDREAPRALNL